MATAADNVVTKRFRNSSEQPQLSAANNYNNNNNNNNLRKIRVICSDPEATDSSSDEADSTARRSSRKIVCEILIRPNPQQPQPQDSFHQSETNETRKKTKLAGVRLRKWGKWASEIRDPFTRKRIWLGTFNTAEEASKAYIAKKMEFQARKTNQTRPKPKPDAHPPVHWKKSSRWREAVYEPSGNNCDSDSDPEEEALKTLQSMKKQSKSNAFGSQKIEPLSGSGETVSGTTTDSAADSNEELNKPPWSGLGIDMLVIDNHGKLLGQFSRLDDDMNIC